MPGHYDFDGTLSLPEMIEIDPVEVCNLRCRMCHVSFMSPEPRPVFDVELLSQLPDLSGTYVAVASGFEPTMYHDFDRFMKGLSDLGASIQIITNGVLLDRSRRESLLASNMAIINFSFDGIRKPTFEFIRRGAHFEKTMENILETREAFRGRDTAFLVNSTTMKSNLEETIEAIDFWDRHDFDVVRFLPMVVRHPDADLIRESLYPIRQRAKQVFEEAALHIIENNLKIVMLRPYEQNSEVARRHPANCTGLYVRSLHPEARIILSLRERFQLGDHPLMRYYACRAAFNTATILANGDVQLCYKYSVGSLKQNTFEEIWFGEEARRVRQTIINATDDCDACDCYRYGIAFHKLSVDRLENHFSMHLAPYLKSIDFQTGIIDAKLVPKPPRLVHTEGAHNIVAYDDRYIVIPHSLGPLEIDKADLSIMPGVFVGKTYQEAMASLRAARDPQRHGVLPGGSGESE
jgi:MoaA/NifB/PqqE/SkfB family radical SAM enzyme